MTVVEFNEINTKLSDLIVKLENYEHVDITEARKMLKESGKRIANFYYKIFENGKQETTNT